MEYKIFYDQSHKIFIIEVHGPFNVDGFNTLADVLLAHPRWVPGTNCLFDYTNTTFFEVSPEHFKEIAGIHKRKNEIIGKGKSAFVMNGDLNYGLGRMYEGIAGPTVDTSFYIFSDYHKAKEWLMEAQSASD